MSDVLEAIEACDLARVQAGLQDVDAVVYKDGKRALHVCAIFGATPIARWLLGQGAQVDASDGGGHTPLALASKYGHTDLQQLLVASGAGLDTPNRAFMLRPLHFAAKEGHRAAVELLIVAGADVSAAAKDGILPLHLAAQHGRWDAAAALVRGGAAPDAKDAVGFTPLHMAVEAKHERLAQLLLRLGADPDAANKHGWTPLHLAAANGSVGAVRCLLEYGANVEAVNSAGKTPHAVAVEAHEAAVVPLLNAQTAAQLARPALMATAGASAALDSALHELEPPPAAPAPAPPAAPAAGAAAAAAAAAAGSRGTPAGPTLGSISGMGSLLGSLGLEDSASGGACPFCAQGPALPASLVPPGGVGLSGGSSVLSSSGAGEAALAEGVPSLFLCPLSRRVLRDPVVCIDGFSYDRRALLDWFASGARTSPLTKEPLPSTATLPNHVVRCAVEEWLAWRQQRQARAQRTKGGSSGGHGRSGPAGQ